MMRMAIVALLSVPLVQDAAEQAKQAVQKTRAQKSYSALFTGTLQVPNSDAMEIKGESVWVTPGVLFLKYKASGGDEVRLVRVGDKVWMFHLQIEDWIPAEQAGRGGAGRGLQNPDEVLALIAKVQGKAAAGGSETINGLACTVLNIELKGEEMGNLLKDQTSHGNFDWKESKGSARIAVAPDGLLRRLAVAAELKSTDPKLEGKKVTYKADVTVKAYQAAYAMPFGTIDPRTKKETPIPVSLEILEEIEKTRNIPDELKAEVAKMKAALPK